MDCATCQEHFTDLLEESQSPQATEAGLHLEQCPGCARAFEGFRTTVSQLRTLPLIAPPPQMLAQITAALDETAPAEPLWRTYWQPAAAAASLAACCLIMLWAFVLNPVNVIDLPQSSPQSLERQVAAPAMSPATGQPARAMASPPAYSGRQPRTQMPRAARWGGNKPLAATAETRGPAASGRAPQFGSWGSRLASVPVVGMGPGTGKPAGTFAAGDPGEAVLPPLQRRAGEVQLAFLPPVERPVGAPVVGQLVVDGQAEALVRVTLLPRGELRLLGVERGVLYQGELRSGQKLQLPVKMIAARAGTQRLLVRLEGDVPGVAAELEVVVPGFIGEARSEPEPLVTLAFKEVPSARAIREMAAAAGARVVLHEGVNGQLVTQDYSAGVPFAAALRILCDACGYRIEDRAGVYHIHLK